MARKAYVRKRSFVGQAPIWIAWRPGGPWVPKHFGEWVEAMKYATGGDCR